MAPCTRTFNYPEYAEEQPDLDVFALDVCVWIVVAKVVKYRPWWWPHAALAATVVKLLPQGSSGYSGSHSRMARL